MCGKADYAIDKPAEGVSCRRTSSSDQRALNPSSTCGDKLHIQMKIVGTLQDLLIKKSFPIILRNLHRDVFRKYRQ